MFTRSACPYLVRVCRVFISYSRARTERHVVYIYIIVDVWGNPTAKSVLFGRRPVLRETENKRYTHPRRVRHSIRGERNRTTSYRRSPPKGTVFRVPPNIRGNNG